MDVAELGVGERTPWLRPAQAKKRPEIGAERSLETGQLLGGEDQIRDLGRQWVLMDDSCELPDLPGEGGCSRIRRGPALVESNRIGSGAEVPGASAGQPTWTIAPRRSGWSEAIQSAHSDPSELPTRAGRSRPSSLSTSRRNAMARARMSRAG